MREKNHKWKCKLVVAKKKNLHSVAWMQLIAIMVWVARLHPITAIKR